MALQESPLQTGAAVFVERHGYQLPAVYSDFASEYEAATNAVGVHDASYMGRLKATGEDGLDLLNRMSTNKVVDLAAGEGAVTVLTTDRGRIVDVLGVLNQGDYVLLLTSPGQQQSVIDHLDKYTIMEDLTVEDVTSETVMLALLGPDAGKLLGLTSSAGPQDSLTIQSVRVGGYNALAVAQPLGVLPRYWLMAAPDAAAGLWHHLTANGATPIGATAMDAVRNTAQSLGSPTTRWKPASSVRWTSPKAAISARRSLPGWTATRRSRSTWFPCASRTGPSLRGIRCCKMERAWARSHLLRRCLQKAL